jgi:hypothetical protein
VNAPDFTPHDLRTLAQLSRPIAEALRTSQRVDAARRQDHGHAPGMVLLGRHNEVELVTPPAKALLDRLRGQSPATHEPIPLPVLTVASMARQRAHSNEAGSAPSLEVPTASGWLSLHASVPHGARAGQVAVVIQPATDTRSVGLELEAYGLTEREREVTGLTVKASPRLSSPSSCSCRPGRCRTT